MTERKKAMTPPLKRHHAAKKSPAQLQREIDEALYGADFDRLSRSPGLSAAPSTFDAFDREWERLAEQGKTDDLGGAEYRRVKNEWVSAGRPTKAIKAFIRSSVSLLPYSQSGVHAKRVHAKRLTIYEKGQRIAMLDDRGPANKVHSTTRGHAMNKPNEDRAESIAFGTKWAEDRFREDPDYSAFTLDMIWIDPAVVPNAKKREAVKNLICTAAVKRWRALRDQAKLAAASSRVPTR